MLRTPVTSIAACAQPHWFVKPGGLNRSPKRCGIVTLRIDSTVGISLATGAFSAPRCVLCAARVESVAPGVKLGRIAGATIPAVAIFRKSLRFWSLIRIHLQPQINADNADQNRYLAKKTLSI